MSEPTWDLEATLAESVRQAREANPPDPHPENLNIVIARVTKASRGVLNSVGYYGREDAERRGLDYCDRCDVVADLSDLHGCGMHHTGCKELCDFCLDLLPPCELDTCGCCGREHCAECDCGCSTAKGCFP